MPRPNTTKPRPKPDNIFNAETTMYEAKAEIEARHVREQLIVYELRTSRRKFVLTF